MLRLTRRELALILACRESIRAEDQAIRSKAEFRRLQRRTLASMQEVMGALPQSPPGAPPVQVHEEFVSPTWTRKKITFASGDGDFVPAYLFLPKGPRHRQSAALCLHQTTELGKAEPAGLGGNRNLHYALELAERGFVTLAPDYPNFGEYVIDPYAVGYVSATMKGIRNHRRALDLLSSFPEVDPRSIGVVGHSLGGHNALFLASFDPRVATVVTSCGFTSFSKYYRGDLTGWSHVGYMPRIASVYGKAPEMMPFDFPAILQGLAPRPIFINAPTRDTNFDVSGVRDCVRAARQVYAGVFGASDRMEVAHPEGGHDFPEPVRSVAYGFMKRWLGSSGSASRGSAGPLSV